MRTYLVILDDTQESRVAMRYASRRAVKVGGDVQILALAPKQDFSAFGAVQATIEEEARDRAEVQAMGAAGSLFAESGRKPKITVRMGDGAQVVADYIDDHPEVTALVLGASKGSNPGPLVTHFAAKAGSLKCPLFIIPGHYDDDAIDRLS